MGVGTFISVGRALETAIQRAEQAERLGYGSVWVTHIAGRDSFTVLTAYASRTERIRLGTGVLPIYSRTPVATAQAAATLDEFSGGRMVLGLGVSHQVTVEHWFGQAIDKPVPAMREYVAAVRAILRGEDPPPAERFPTSFRFMGFEARPDLPVYIAALSPAMLRLAGEIADGVVLWLCTPQYVRDVVVPEVARGRERAGKPLEGFDIVAAVPAACTTKPDEARDKLRSDLVPYFNLPFYRAMIERSGFTEEVERAQPSDRFIDALAAIGDADGVVAGVQRYLDAGATSPCVGAIPRTDFAATLEAAAHLTTLA